jgi:hypothetical protein
VSDDPNGTKFHIPVAGEDITAFFSPLEEIRENGPRPAAKFAMPPAVEKPERKRV